jgi:serine/threonine protein kinase
MIGLCDVCAVQRPPMMHRDLKSPNVLLSEEGVAKIADVGMVRSQVKDLVTAQPVMTPLWAAPEVRTGTCNDIMLCR